MVILMSLPALAVEVPRITRLVSLVMKSVPLKPVSSLMAVMATRKEALKMPLSSDRVSVASALLLTRAAKKSCRLVDVTSASPMRLRSATVMVGAGVVPAALA